MELNEKTTKMVKDHGKIKSLDDIDRVMPLLVKEANDRGHLSIGMCHVAPLIKAVTVLANEVRDLREQNDRLKRSIRNLEAQ